MFSIFLKAAITKKLARKIAWEVGFVTGVSPLLKDTDNLTKEDFSPLTASLQELLFISEVWLLNLRRSLFVL